MKKNPAAILAKKRWKGVSKEDRREHARQMGLASGKARKAEKASKSGAKTGV